VPGLVAFNDIRPGNGVGLLLARNTKSVGKFTCTASAQDDISITINGKNRKCTSYSKLSNAII